MNCKYLILVFFTCSLADQHHHVLTFFVRDLEKKPFTVNKNPFVGLTKKMIKYNIKTKTPKNIFSLYMGYLTLSDDRGQITFPRLTHKTNFNILIVEKIMPEFMFPNTISHWKIESDIPFKFYNLERKEENSTSFWSVTVGDPPKDRKIPIETIIILTKPKNILYPTGKFLTTNLPQLVLPDVYIKKSFSLVDQALFVLQIKKFFSSLNFVYDVKKGSHSKIIKR